VPYRGLWYLNSTGAGSRHRPGLNVSDSSITAAGLIGQPDHGSTTLHIDNFNACPRREHPAAERVHHGPGSGTVSGTVAVTAGAFDTVGVTKVEFLDSLNPDTTSPYAWNWDTSTAAVGSHTLMVKA
jgi:hypothetical protein